MQTIQFSVYLKKKKVADIFLLLSDSLELFVISSGDNTDGTLFHLDFSSQEIKAPSKKYKIVMDGYLCSIFHYVLKTSIPFGKLMINKLLDPKTLNNENKQTLVKIVLVYPEKEMIDYRGNEMFEVSCLERRELDSAMAWFSTLGGAFSALGDGMEKCAIMAGKISLKQMQIALKLGDPYLVARCKLYLALSLIQRHHFRRAKELIIEQYRIARQGPLLDIRLVSICKGIWSKFKYDRSHYKVMKKKKRKLS